MENEAQLSAAAEAQQRQRCWRQLLKPQSLPLTHSQHYCYRQQQRRRRGRAQRRHRTAIDVRPACWVGWTDRPGTLTTGCQPELCLRCVTFYVYVTFYVTLRFAN